MHCYDRSIFLEFDFLKILDPAKRTAVEPVEKYIPYSYEMNI